MRIKKQELSFLKHYKELATDAKTYITLELKGNTLTAYQVSDMAVLVKSIEVDNNDNESFESILPAKTFVDLIDTIRSDEIEISQNKVTFNNGKSSYPFPVENDVVLRPYTDYLDLLNQTAKLIQIKDVSMLIRALPFVSDSREGNSIGVFNGKFFAKSGGSQVAMIETSNSDSIEFYFDAELVSFFATKLNDMNIEIYEDVNTYHFMLEGIHVFTSLLDASNHFAQIKQGGLNMPLSYEHSVKVNRKNLLQTVQRAAIVLSDDSVVMMTFEEDSIKIQPISADSDEMSDFCEAHVDSELIGVTFPTTVKRLIDMISDKVFKDETVKIKYKKDNIPMRIHNEDEQGKDIVNIFFSREKV